MLCKYCGAQCTGGMCPACGKTMPLVKRSTELDGLMDDASSSPIPTPAVKTISEQELKESYQRGIKDSYDKEVTEQQTSSESVRTNNKKIVILCAVIFIVSASVSGIISGSISYRKGLKQGTSVGAIEGQTEGIRIASSTYEPQIQGLKAQHRENIEQAKREGYEEGYSKAKKEQIQSTGTPALSPTQIETPYPTPGRIKTMASPNIRVSPPFDFPYSRSKNERTYNSVVHKIQTRLRELNYKTGKLDGYLGPNTETAIKQYQKDNHLPITGAVDTETYRLLFPDEVIPEEQSESKKGTAEPQPQIQQKPSPSSLQPTSTVSSSPGVLNEPMLKPTMIDSSINNDSADLADQD